MWDEWPGGGQGRLYLKKSMLVFSLFFCRMDSEQWASVMCRWEVLGKIRYARKGL